MGFKVTKKVIKAAPEYILGIDYKASYKPLTIELVPMANTDLVEAMKEANEYWNDNEVWCLNLFRKSDVVEDDCLLYKTCVGAWSDGHWTVEEERFTCRYMLEWKEAIW